MGTVRAMQIERVRGRHEKRPRCSEEGRCFADTSDKELDPREAGVGRRETRRLFPYMCEMNWGTRRDVIRWKKTRAARHLEHECGVGGMWRMMVCECVGVARASGQEGAS